MPTKNLEQNYKNRIQQFNKTVKQIKRKLIWISVLRFVFFVGAIALFVLLVKSFNWFVFVIFVGFLISFVFFILFYNKKTEDLNHLRNLIRTNQDEINALQHQFDMFHPGNQYLNREHPYSYDLDLFGEGSLFQYLNRTVTLVGRDLLANRLSHVEDARPQLIKEKQESVREISEKLNWRQNFMAFGYSQSANEKDNKNINHWLDQPIYFLKKLIFKLLVIFLPLVTLTFLVLLIAGISHYSLFTILVLTQLFIASTMARKTNREQRLVSEEMRILKIYSRLIKHIENEEFNSEILRNLKEDLKTDNIKAQVALKKLIKIIDALDTRLNIFLGVVLNGILMWDLLSLMRLEKWKLRYGNNVTNWINIIAEFDFYSSAGNFLYNFEFAFPEVNNKSVIDAKELGHPLIKREKRINNDFKLTKQGEINIVTGANMAGKSTFLRTVGVNLILAMNGLPVCAKSFEFQIVELYTGMRTADSLKENESYFYAELKRLKQIIDALKKDKLTFLLLDEILKGTNSVDKAKGSWKFVENLIKLNATGVVATHDLSLCKMEEKYPKEIKNTCFEVEIDHNKIHFDYKLRSGVTKNMNASILMQQMGIFSN